MRIPSIPRSYGRRADPVQDHRCNSVIFDDQSRTAQGPCLIMLCSAKEGNGEVVNVLHKKSASFPGPTLQAMHVPS